MIRRLFALFALVSLVGCSSDDGPTSPGATDDLANIFPESEAVITRDADEIRLRLVTVRFSTGTADLTASSKPVLDKFAQVFPLFPDAIYSVEGHTDSRGTESYNLRISEERASAVRQHFIDKANGVADDIFAKGFGETLPIEDNATSAGRAVNRRVEVIIHLDN